MCLCLQSPPVDFQSELESAVSTAVVATQERMREVMAEQQKMLAAAEADVQELRQALAGERGQQCLIAVGALQQCGHTHC